MTGATPRLAGLLIALIALSALGGVAYADDLSNAVALQRQVNAEIDAIKTTAEPPSNACVSALQEMHTAEQQLLDLTGDPSNAPSGSALAENEQGEVAVGRDVLASDLDAAASACRPDAARACSGSSAAKISKSCAIMSHAAR